MSNAISLNGHGSSSDGAHADAMSLEAAAARQMAEAAFAGYPQLAAQLGAIITLLSALPLPLMLEANERHQRASVLTLPANVTAQQAAEIAAALRNDARMIRACIGVRDAAIAISQGR